MQKEKKLEQKERKSRAKYKCLPELDEVIKTVNAVPPDVDLPAARDVIDKIEKEYFTKHNVERKSDLDENTFINMWWDIFDECFKDFLDENAKKRIFTHWFERTNESLSELKKTEVALFWSVYDTYEFIRKTRTDVKKIIRYVKELNDKSPILFLYDTNLHTPLIFTQKNGETRAILPPFAKVIERIDLERLRFCEICRRVFWAENKNSFTCSETCRNALRQRRYRKVNKEAINAKRRANYRRNKKIKQIKEGKNGDL